MQGNDSKKFSAHLKEREKTVLRKFIRSNWREALKANAKIPPRLYTNQSESVNSILAAKNVALDYNKKDDVTKSFFIQDLESYRGSPESRDWKSNMQLEQRVSTSKSC